MDNAVQVTWARLVAARVSAWLWEQEAASSNLAIPTGRGHVAIMKVAAASLRAPGN
jgi:hypothetical protein